MIPILSDAEREALISPVHISPDHERNTWTEPGAYSRDTNGETDPNAMSGLSNTEYPAPSTASASFIQQLTELDDVAILELEETRSWKPNPVGSLYNMYLRLSAEPSEAWQRLFAEERRFPRHNRWRQARIEGNCIVICCAPGEMEPYHFSDLQDDVRATNTNFRNYLFHLAQQEALTEQLHQQIERNNRELEWKKNR